MTIKNFAGPTDHEGDGISIINPQRREVAEYRNRIGKVESLLRAGVGLRSLDCGSDALFLSRGKAVDVLPRSID